MDMNQRLMYSLRSSQKRCVDDFWWCAGTTVSLSLAEGNSRELFYAQQRHVQLKPRTLVRESNANK